MTAGDGLSSFCKCGPHCTGLAFLSCGNLRGKWLTPPHPTPPPQLRSRRTEEDLEQNPGEDGLFTGTEGTAPPLDAEISEKWALLFPDFYVFQVLPVITTSDHTGLQSLALFSAPAVRGFVMWMHSLYVKELQEKSVSNKVSREIKRWIITGHLMKPLG